MNPDCKSCAQSMQGNDLLLRCRVHGYPCSPAAAEDCAHFIYEPGTDSDEVRGWCVTTSTEGRGD